MLSGLSQINVEISSICQKRTKCGFCGHQDPSIHPTLRFGTMSRLMMVSLRQELKPLGKHVIVQAHRDGDPCDSDELGYFLERFRENIRSVVTHGCSLVDRAEDIIGNCEAVCVSIFRGDPDRELQLTALREFMKVKGEKLPRVLLKVIGDMNDDELHPFLSMDLPILQRRLHLSSGNSRYVGGMPTMFEHGICDDLLHHPSISWDGRVYLCNRLDTKDAGLIGNLNEESLDSIWNGKLRADYIQKHIEGRRADVPPCKDCLYYGVPSA